MGNVSENPENRRFSEKLPSVVLRIVNKYVHTCSGYVGVIKKLLLLVGEILDHWS